jgi:hypothetical protein
VIRMRFPFLHRISALLTPLHFSGPPIFSSASLSNFLRLLSFPFLARRLAGHSGKRRLLWVMALQQKLKFFIKTIFRALQWCNLLLL